MTGCFAPLLSRPILPPSSSVIATRIPRKRQRQPDSSLLVAHCGLKAECRKSRSLDHCWITASLLRTAAALQNEYVHNEKRQRLLLCTTQLCWCVAACRMYEYFITCWCRIYLARVLLQYFYLCLLVLWDLLYVSTYAKYYNCNRCCREKLAPPVICNSRQLVRVGGSWTGVVR